jgi:hypothetical protein
MHFVNDDLLGDLDDDKGVLILVISDDLVDLEMENESILILEICLEEYFEVDLDDENREFVSEKI